MGKTLTQVATDLQDPAKQQQLRDAAQRLGTDQLGLMRTIATDRDIAGRVASRNGQSVDEVQTSARLQLGIVEGDFNGDMGAYESFLLNAAKNPQVSNRDFSGLLTSGDLKNLASAPASPAPVTQPASIPASTHYTAKGADGHTYTISKDGNIRVEINPDVRPNIGGIRLSNPQDILREAEVTLINGQPAIKLSRDVMNSLEQPNTPPIILSDIRDSSGNPSNRIEASSKSQYVVKDVVLEAGADGKWTGHGTKIADSREGFFLLGEFDVDPVNGQQTNYKHIRGLDISELPPTVAAVTAAVIVKSEQIPPDESFLIADYQQRVNQGFIKPGQPAIYETGGGTYHINVNEHGLLDVQKQPESASPTPRTITESQYREIQNAAAHMMEGYEVLPMSGPKPGTVGGATPVVWGNEGQGQGFPPRGVSPSHGVTGADIASQYIYFGGNKLMRMGSPEAEAELARLRGNAPARPDNAAAAAAMGGVPPATGINPGSPEAFANIMTGLGNTDFKSMTPEQIRVQAIGFYQQTFAGASPEQRQQTQSQIVSSLEILQRDGKINEDQAKAIKNIVENSESEEAFAAAVVENKDVLDSIGPIASAPAAPAAPGRTNGTGSRPAPAAAGVAAAGAGAAAGGAAPGNGVFDLQSMMQNMSQMGGLGAIFGLIAMVIAAIQNPGALKDMNFGAFLSGGMGGNASPDQVYQSIDSLPDTSLQDAMKLPVVKEIAPEVRTMMETIYKNSGHDGKPVQYHFGGNQAFLVSRNAAGEMELRDIDGKDVKGAVTSFVQGGPPMQVARLRPENIGIMTWESRPEQRPAATTPAAGAAAQTTEGRLKAAAGEGAVLVRGNFPEAADIKYGGGHIEAQKLNGQQIAINREQGGTYSLTVEERKNGNEIHVTTYNGIEKTDLPTGMQKTITDAFSATPPASTPAPAAGPQVEQQLAQQGQTRAPGS